MPRGLRGIAQLIALLAIAGCVQRVAAESSTAEPLPATAPESAIVQRGRYLTDAGDCVACHTEQPSGKPFAGGRSIQTPFGIVVSPNITPDRKTGIGTWSDDQFDAAVRHGRRPDGMMYPAMPFPYYARMSRDDVLAIHAYLKTDAPVEHEVHSNKLPFPFSIRAMMHVWDAFYFNDKPFAANSAKSAQWNRGAYLVQGPGHCAACHTPKNFLGGDKSQQAFQGYALQGWFAPNITNDDTHGLGKWSVEDIVSYLKTGHNRLAGASGMMAEEVEYSSSRLTDPDLQAVATYLKDQPGRSRGSTPAPASSPVANAQLSAGKAIYEDLCSACHAPDGRGVPYLIPDLAESSSVVSRDATSLVRVVVHGADTVATDKEPTGPAMPAFGWQLTDDQIAAVTTYVRNSWGHTAAAVTAGEVSKARKPSGPGG
jgi:mono/diheme cytochrome c family protein